MEAKIELTIDFVKRELQDAEAGHDWWHIERVWKTAREIAKKEKVDLLVVDFAALLHDIADSKFNDGNETLGPKKAGVFLTSIGVKEEIVAHVQRIIENMSYKNSFDKSAFSSLEMQVVQDADRLDAMGAIGVARAFHYGGYKNRQLYDPNIHPEFNLTKDAYKKSTSPTINHFYEKLLLLKDKMNTESGKQLAANRHQFMLLYLEQFYAEWNGEK